MLSTLELLTGNFVRQELRQAFKTLARLPEKQRPRRLMVRTPLDRQAIAPTVAEIARMEVALAWIDHLADEPVAVCLAVSLRARGLSLREVAAEIGVSAPTVTVREARGLDLIVQRLRVAGVLPGDVRAAA